MGLIATILGAGARLLGFGGAAAGAGAARGAAAAAPTLLSRVFGGVSRFARAVLPIGAGVAAGELIAGGLRGGGGGAGAAALAAGDLGGNGMFTTITIVQTLSNATGEVVRQRTLRGSPFLMNRDIGIAKRVFRTATKLHGRLPRRAVQQSRTKMFTDRLLDKALDDALCPGSSHMVVAKT